MRFLTVNLVANKKKKTIERYYIFYTLMSWFKKKKKGREREKKSINYLNSECVCVCVFMCSVGSWCFTARHPDLRTAKKEALVV